MVVLAFLGVAPLSFWHRHALMKAESSAAELRQLKTQWEVASANLEEARKSKARFDAFAEQAARVTEECNRRNWSSALQGIVGSTGESIQLRDIRARRTSEEEERWSLRLAGLSFGSGRRAEADTFCSKIQREIEKAFGAAVIARLEQVEERPNVEVNRPGEPAAAFVIEVAIEPVAPSQAQANRGS